MTQLVRGGAFAALVVTLVSTAVACGGAEQRGAADPSSASSSSGGGTGSGAAATDFTARDTDGNTVRLSDHLGKSTILLNFCATWCEPCVAEFPHLRRMYEENKGKGLVILAIAMDGPESIAAVPAFAKTNQLNFPLLVDDDSHIAQIYNPKKSAPLSVIIDKNGKIASIREGYNPGDEEFLEKDVLKLLGGN
ncbi:MAG: TlpA family protein disulfide reductase [Myxococcales bacterium]|nr:TlpA family protein disulfide reductase [Myxococcales bacterium]